MGLQCAYLIHLERLLMTPRGLHADQTKWASHAIKGAANFSLPPHFSLGLSLTVFLHFLPSKYANYKMVSRELSRLVLLRRFY